MKKRHKVYLRLAGAPSLIAAIFASFIALPMSSPSFAGPSDSTDNIQVKSFPTHSRLIVRIDDSVNVEWKSDARGFRAFFRGLGFADFGAPLGEEERWARQFREIRDPRLESMEFKEVSGGLVLEGRWKFPKGQDAPAEPRMETFDYRDKDPGGLVVDFWLKKGPTVAEVAAIRKQKAQADADRKAREVIAQRVNRKVATEKAKVELNDISKFCREPLDEKNTVFLPFLPAHESFDFSRWIPSTTPDSQFSYFVPNGKDKESGYVRLAQDLYKQGKHGLAVRTIDFLDAEYPESRYRNEMTFLRANALLKLGLASEGERILDRLRYDARGSAVSLHSAMFMAARQLERKNYLGAQEAFSWLNQNFAEHRLGWVFHLGAAESLYAIKQTDRAAKEYQWVMQNAPKPEQKAEGAFRLGDLYLDRLQYEQALGAYSQAIRYFKNESLSFPALYLNRIEALYWLGQYDQAQTTMDAYLKLFPTYPEGWRATYRLGEILSRKADPASREEGRKWFYETINRYPFGKGSTLARLRLLPCGDHGGFAYESAKKFLEGEAKTYDGSGVVSMVHYPDFVGLADVQSLISFGKEDLAVDAASREMNRTKLPELKKTYAWLFESLFRRNIVALLEQGKKYEALAFYNERVQFLGRDKSSVDPDYLLKLSAAASDLSLGKLAESLAEAYRKSSGADRAVAAESGVSAIPADLDLRLKKSEQAFVEAKALWISGRGESAADTIRSKLALVIPESPHSFQRELILALLDEKQGKIPAALGHALQAQILMPAGVSANDSLRISGWLAALESKGGDRRAALEMYRTVEKRLRAAEAEKAKRTPSSEDDEEDVDTSSITLTLGIPETPSLTKTMFAQAEILEKQGKWGESASTYARVVEDGTGGNQALYGYARALLKSGAKSGREKAIGTLEKIASGKEDDFWKKLATEALAVERIKREQFDERVKRSQEEQKSQNSL